MGGSAISGLRDRDSGRRLSTICLPGVGGDTYDITGKNFTIGRLATWRQSLFVRPNNVVTMQIDGTLDLADATNPRTFQVNDLTLIRGGGVIRAGGDYSSLLSDRRTDLRIGHAGAGRSSAARSQRPDRDA